MIKLIFLTFCYVQKFWDQYTRHQSILKVIACVGTYIQDKTYCKDGTVKLQIYSKSINKLRLS